MTIQNPKRFIFCSFASGNYLAAYIKGVGGHACGVFWGGV